MSNSIMKLKLSQKSTVVYDVSPVLLVGGAEPGVMSLKYLESFSGKIVAADGGVRHILGRNKQPKAVIGDFDSLSACIQGALPEEVLHPVSEQDSTDFEKCLTRIQAPLILAMGFTGGRLDHELAVLHGLLAFPDRICVLIGSEDVLFLTPPEFQISLPPATRYSLMPLLPVVVNSAGLRWPMGGAEFAPGHRIGTSNEVAEGEGDVLVTVSCDQPGLLTILPREHLDAVIKSLLALPEGSGHWPARAR